MPLRKLKKAYGLEKKIVNPVDARTEGQYWTFVLFMKGKEAVPAHRNFLKQKRFGCRQNVGLTVVPHLRDCYHLFYDVKVNILILGL